MYEQPNQPTAEIRPKTPQPKQNIRSTHPSIFKSRNPKASESSPEGANSDDQRIPDDISPLIVRMRAALDGRRARLTYALGMFYLSDPDDRFGGMLPVAAVRNETPTRYTATVACPEVFNALRHGRRPLLPCDPWAASSVSFLAIMVLNELGGIGAPT